MRRKNVDDDKALREELSSARNTILRLSRKRLDWDGYMACVTPDVQYRWRYALVREAIELAEVVSAPGSVDRAYCPLCGEGASSFTADQGFAVPVGLEQHLMGLGRASPCDVTQAAFALATEAIQQKNEM